jgi:quercetin dioxygenase-like cupin family protein
MWSAIPVETIAHGIERQMVWGERLMVCRLTLAPHVVTNVHSHPHEQITLVERGRVRFTVDGQERILSAGDVLHFPSGVPHGATMLDEEVVLVDIFTPVREDFLASS